MEIASEASSIRRGARVERAAATGPIGRIVLVFGCLLLLNTGTAAARELHVNHADKSVAKQPGKHRGHRPRKPRPTYWGAWIGDQLTGSKPPWDMSAVTRFEELTGKGLSLIEFSQPFYDCSSSPCAPYEFPTAEMEKIRDYGAVPFLSWASDSLPVPKVPSEPDFQLSDVLAGTYDGFIREFAEAAKAWGHPFFLRFNWEMNGNWFPWGQSVNGNQPGEVVAVWRHVRDIFTAAGATNATWIWCPYADPLHRFGDIAKLYPGNAYVDWTCMDGYNWAANPTNSHPRATFDEIFSSTYKKILEVAPKKPIVLGEVASTGGDRAKSAWIRDMFKQLRTDYRRIRGLIWLDEVDRRIDWPLETSVAATRAFAQGIRHQAFKSNSYASTPPSPVPPPH